MGVVQHVLYYIIISRVIFVYIYTCIQISDIYTHTYINLSICTYIDIFILFFPLFTRECRRSLPSAYVVQHLNKIRLPLLLTVVIYTEVVFTNYVCFFVLFLLDFMSKIKKRPLSVAGSLRSNKVPDEEMAVLRSKRSRRSLATMAI